MKSLKKKIAALAATVMMATSALSMSASAEATWEPWGPHYYTPYTGKFSAGIHEVEVHNLVYSASQVNQLKEEQKGDSKKYAGEFEFRPEMNVHDIWDVVTGFNSNLPFAYREFQIIDADDTSIGTKEIASVVAGTSYYGAISFTPKTANLTSNNYIFESEYAQEGVGSALLGPYPIKYEQLTGSHFISPGPVGSNVVYGW